MKEQAEHKSSSSQFLKTDGGKTKSNAIEVPSISLPKGGGAIKGIDEKFSVNAVNGTSAFSVPLPISPGRNGFQPTLSLSYNSGAGNSPFGLGWNVDFPSIQRKTDKKLPQYLDGDESDVFMFSGAEDLVPEFKKDGIGNFITDVNENNEVNEFESINKKFTIKTYRPRIEGGFARLERISQKDGSPFYWKVTTKENVVTFFGRTADYQVADPVNPKRVFQWLPELSFDDKGNIILFEYKKEDGAIGNISVHDANRFDKNGHPLFTQQYLKRIRYGNRQPFYPDYVNNPANESEIYNPTVTSGINFFFELVFDYGEHGDEPIKGKDTINVSYSETKKWLTRQDAFSSFRSGFDIRTYRLCKRVLQFHIFKELSNDPCLVRSLDLEFSNSVKGTAQETEVTHLLSVKHTGYTVKADGSYMFRSLPKIEFEYQPLNWSNKIQNISDDDIIHAPVGLSNGYQWVDLFNEGVSGILTEQADAWYYKINNGNGEFTVAMPVAPKPSFVGLSKGVLSLQDLDADGNKQIVIHQQNKQGFFEISDDNEWLPFEVFQQYPNINLSDPHTHLIDLNGDGKADLLLTEELAFRWYPSKGKTGYDSPELSPRFNNEENGPAMLVHDEIQSIFLADMSGDGLTDIVRIRNGEICYWPNIGYGLFGNKVTMSHSPVFDDTELFNPSYLHLVDISGTGATDIIYLGKNKFNAWINLSGNAWNKQPYEIEPFLSVEQPNNIAVVDLLGNGTACIVWSSPLPGNSNTPMRYIDLMGGRKPHVMVKHINNLGKETVLEYKSSTQYYLEDKKAGKPWVTKLPFPVQCVSKLEVIDRVTDLRFTNKYVYHHGYYDHAEREFRGFGMVEQTDTEEYEYLKNSKASNATNIEFHEPPVLTKTWFHTGAYLRNQKILDHFKHEYWYNEPLIIDLFGDLSKQEPALPDALFIGSLTTPELVEAHRACKGMALRQEVFALDGSAQEKIPYSVATHDCHIKLLQPRNNNRNAIFLVHESEAITFSYERNVHDPRTAHTLNLEIDDLGNVLKAAEVVYPRKVRPAELTENKIWNEQNRLHIILTEADFTNDILTSIAYRLRLPYQTKTYELQLIKNLTGNNLYSIADLNIIAAELPYEATFTPNIDEKRLIEQVKTIYLKNDLTTPAKEGEHDTLGFNLEAYQLAFTSSLLDNIYKKPAQPSKVDPSMLIKGKYIDLKNDGHWWIRSGTVQYFNTLAGETNKDAAKRFYLPLSYTDPFGSLTSVSYYKDYHLFVQQTKDALDNVTSIEEFDFRVLAPKKVKDINANFTEVAIDTLGLVVGTAIMGKGAEADDLFNLEPDLTSQQVQDFFADPINSGRALLQHATSRLVYDFTTIPCSIGTIAREEHHKNNPSPKLQYSFEYSGGLGNVVLKKIQAEPGDAPHRNPQGKLVKKPNGDLDLQTTQHRWIGNGRTILNNKGQPVKQYEPYFSDSHLYEDEPELREAGVTPILHYDAAGRLVKTTMPDDTFSKVEYDAWMQKTYDANDTTILMIEGKPVESKWYSDRINRLLDAEFIAQGKDPVKEKEAAAKAGVHANTPSVVHTDSLGRPFYTIDHNKFDNFAGGTKEEFYDTQAILDIENNLRAVIDARNNTVMQYKYDMLGNLVYQNSMDAGERWLLNDCMGKPVLAWDSKDQLFETKYDPIHRPLTQSVNKFSATPVITTIFEKSEYVDTKGLSGPQLTAQQAKNLMGKLITHHDSAGIVRLTLCDFKGNTLESSRQLCQDPKKIPDWTNIASMTMEQETFITKTEFDALNRSIKLFTPHTFIIPSSVISPEYNEANLLNAISAKLRGSIEDTPFVRNIEYDAKGLRVSILFNNNTLTTYTYDPKTFRLLSIITTRNSGSDILQDLHYTYDPVGNITYIKDGAQPTIFFDNLKATADCDYVYDSIYRLIQAKGREHIGNSSSPDAYDSSRMRDADKRDGTQIKPYTQRYGYDAAGNMQFMRNMGSWHREFFYNVTNNQLLFAPADNEPTKGFQHKYDAHGNMINMPHLPIMDWNFKDQLQHIGINASNDNNNASGAWYVYDGSGERIRKFVEKSNVTEERIYMGGFEIFRRRRNETLELERETLHIMDGTKRIVLIDTQIKPIQQAEPPLIRYQYGNHLGTASLELDGSVNAQIISYEEYYPFGSTSYQATDQMREVPIKRYRYTGKERDEESGLEYHRARYYAVWLGRWVSGDPLGIKGGLNVYTYVTNPIKLVDPNGTVGLPNEYWDAQQNERDADMVKRDDESLAKEVAERESKRRQEVEDAHTVTQTIGMGENYESGGTGAVLGAMISGYLFHDVTPDALDVAALSKTVVHSPTLTGANRQLKVKASSSSLTKPASEPSTVPASQAKSAPATPTEDTIMKSRDNKTVSTTPLDPNAARRLEGQAKNELRETAIGRETLALTKGSDPAVKLRFDPDLPPPTTPGDRGQSHYAEGKSTVFLTNATSKSDVAETAIHETSHGIGLGGKGTMAQEIVPELRAKMHTAALSGEKMELGDVWRTYKWVKNTYPELTVEGTKSVIQELRTWNEFIGWSLQR